MANHLGEFDNGNTSLELFDYEGVSEVVDLGVFDTGDSKVTIDSRADIAD